MNVAVIDTNVDSWHEDLTDNWNDDLSWTTSAKTSNSKTMCTTAPKPESTEGGRVAGPPSVDSGLG